MQGVEYWDRKDADDIYYVLSVDYASEGGIKSVDVALYSGPYAETYRGEYGCKDLVPAE